MKLKVKEYRLSSNYTMYHKVLCLGSQVQQMFTKIKTFTSTKYYNTSFFLLLILKHHFVAVSKKKTFGKSFKSFEFSDNR